MREPESASLKRASPQNANEIPARRRGVCLCDDARRLLNEALIRQWQREAGPRKLTRESRAELLGVSVATAQRILGGERADRATLMLAFKRLGIPWDESFCRPPEAPGLADEPCDSVTPQPLVPTTQSKRRPIGPLLIVASLGLSLVAALVRWPVSSSDSDPWRDRFNESLSAGTTQYQLGNYGAARPLLNGAVLLARQHGSAGSMASAIRMLADVDFAEGRLESAKSRYEQAIELWSLFGKEAAIPAVFEGLGTLKARMGALSDARKDLDRCLRGFATNGDVPGVAMACRDLGWVEYLGGRLDAAKSWYDAALRALELQGKPDIEVDVRGRYALVVAGQGRFAEARRQLRGCLEYWRLRRHPRWVAQTQYQMAMVDASAGRWSDARRLLADGRRGFAAVGDPLGVADCDRLLARAPSATTSASGA